VEKAIAIIPARGGSKRIPRKNIVDFYGRPIIEYSIKAALKTNCFNHVLVSTDCEKIAEVAIKSGAEVLYLRSSELSGDYSGILDVIKAEILKIEKSLSEVFNIVCCIYATAPFIKSDDIHMAIENFYNSDDKLDYMLSVSKFDYPIQRSLQLKGDGLISMKNPENEFIRSQDLSEMYHDAAQFIIGYRESWLEGKSLLNSRVKPFIIPSTRVQDIDTIEDLNKAKVLYKCLDMAGDL
jgi:pseudaminic acid cytidylyltransferase